MSFFLFGQFGFFIFVVYFVDSGVQWIIFIVFKIECVGSFILFQEIFYFEVFFCDLFNQVFFVSVKIEMVIIVFFIYYYKVFWIENDVGVGFFFNVLGSFIMYYQFI